MSAHRTLHEREFTRDYVQDADLASWQYHYRAIKDTVQGTEEEKEAVVRKRILKYFGEFNLDSQNYFAIRLEVDFTNPSIKIIPAQLLLYGIDYLSIERAKEYFKGFLTQIRRVDDSHFLIEFINQQDCLKAINASNEQSLFFRSSQQVLDASNSGWIAMKPYREFIFERKLMARYMSSLDKLEDRTIGGRSSTYYAYSAAKRRFLKNLQGEAMEKRIRQQIKMPKNKSKHNGSRSRDKEIARYRDAMPNICPMKLRTALMLSRQFLDEMPQCCNHKCGCQTRKRHERSSSRSSRSGDSIQDKKRHNYGKFGSIFQDERVKESEFKFQLYRKNRDSKQGKSRKSLSSEKIPSPIKKNNSAPRPDHLGASFQSNISKDISLDFEQYLEKLKLEDSHNDYSAFDLEDGMGS